MSSSAKTLALGALKVAAAAVDGVTPRRRGITALIYHRVGGGSDAQLDLDVATFEAQMGELATAPGVVAIDAALDDLRSPDVPTRDPVVVTFDDGTADWVDNVLPVLERHQVHALFYVATAFVEEQRGFPNNGRPVSWKGLADALSTGFVTIGSHTHTHVLLDRISPSAATDELDRSCELIEDRLGVTPRHFAYPKAVAPSAEIEPLVRERFASAALAGTRPNRYGQTDPHRLARSPIQRADGMRWFRHKVGGGMAFEELVRDTANRVRYRGATT